MAYEYCIQTIVNDSNGANCQLRICSDGSVVDFYIDNKRLFAGDYRDNLRKLFYDAHYHFDQLMPKEEK